ncbi:hypothetical protein EJ419_01845 [Alloscardovia theropitheci]|uniref:Uncharacterized protein n=1 Tax=Alloscardovia theropitheci TaxID=2496842 RepID=A0A4R0QYI9_9BIFI|nr:hypothetical protein [Alloscardovia theropitheci]TCD54860.1 hypothetical protein EJ419_01845 [Alloscardovia theropitheci]
MQINFIDNWEKVDVDLDELTKALETGDSQRYNGKELSKVAKKWKKYSKRGVSQAYLLKELEEDGTACAYYAYSITDGVIPEETLEQIREICARSLSAGEMEMNGIDFDPADWWGTNPEYLTKLVNKGQADELYYHLSAELYPMGIVITTRGVKKRKADRLACSAVAWGYKETGLFAKKNSYMSVLIHNEEL